MTSVEPAIAVAAPAVQTRAVAPAVDNSASVEVVSSAQKYNAATVTLTTAFPGDLLVAFVGSDSPPSGGQSSVVSGAGLTWTKLGAENAQLGDAEVWTARAATPLSAVHITAKQTIQSWDEALTVVAFRNSDGTGATQLANAPKGAPTGTLTTTHANSWVWASGDDWLKSINRTPSSGQTIVHSATDAVGDTYWVQSTTASTPAPGTAVTISDTAPTGDPYNLVLVEILGTTVTVPTITGVVPPSGPVSGRNAVTINGSGLTNASEVDFGPVKVTSGISAAPDGTSVTVAAPPASSVSTVDIRVTTPAGQTSIVPADQYSYTAPPPSPYSGARLTLSPGTAGPNVPHTTQTLAATLTDAHGNPLGGMAVAVTVAGANPTATSVATDAHGVATFTYTGNNAGTDTVTAALRAGADSVTSSPSTVTWAVPTTPVAPVSMDPAQGQFFAEPSSATTFVAKPGDTAAFAQTFPDIAFNPPAGVISNDHYPPSPTTHPLTDVTTDVVGDADGTIPAAGNGQQAGVGALSTFDAVFTTTLHVNQPGDLSYAIDSSDGFLMGIGNGASRVSGDYNNPPASNQSSFNAYNLVAVANQPAGTGVVTHPVTIHFPTAGAYPVEIDYFSTGAPNLSLVLRPSTAVASVPNTPPINVYVGYQDTLRSANDFTISPLPWFGSPGVTFEGDQAAQGSGADSGGIRFDNVTSAPLTIDHVTVDLPVPNNGTPVHYDQWPTGVVIQPGQTLVLAENAGFASFDTSDIDSGTCGLVQKLVPSINVTIGGVTSVYQDTGEVINTGGFDQACIGNESEPWVRVGTTGPANPLQPPPRVGASSAWDDAVHAFVTYGGFDASNASVYRDDTWAWQKGKWTPITSATKPPARAYAGGAYDKATNTFVVFGGYNTRTGTNYDDTWTFDGTTWTQAHPAHAPPALNEASDRMAYDDATGTIVLVTSDSLGSQNPDTWTWDGTDWTEHPAATATQPTARWQPAMSYDPDTGSVILFGGSAGYLGTDLADTWQWDGANWTQLTPATAPPARA
ncbi:MAG TPA: Ig-like domain-containing protein, partial [Pseudonocardiaceae bacterium]|nr:Ig-like domain-containing protein [Pseudonocardiaceae bacterium]